MTCMITEKAIEQLLDQPPVLPRRPVTVKILGERRKEKGKSPLTIGFHPMKSDGHIQPSVRVYYEDDDGVIQSMSTDLANQQTLASFERLCPAAADPHSGTGDTLSTRPPGATESGPEGYTRR